MYYSSFDCFCANLRRRESDFLNQMIRLRSYLFCSAGAASNCRRSRAAAALTIDDSECDNTKSKSDLCAWLASLVNEWIRCEFIEMSRAQINVTTSNKCCSLVHAKWFGHLYETKKRLPTNVAELGWDKLCKWMEVSYEAHKSHVIVAVVVIDDPRLVSRNSAMLGTNTRRRTMRRREEWLDG